MTRSQTPITRDRWTLCDEKTGEPINAGQSVTDFRGDATTISDGRPPHRPGVSGYVTTAEGGEFYPSVFGLCWKNEHGRYFGDGKGA